MSVPLNGSYRLTHPIGVRPMFGNHWKYDSEYLPRTGHYNAFGNTHEEKLKSKGMTVNTSGYTTVLADTIVRFTYQHSYKRYKCMVTVKENKHTDISGFSFMLNPQWFENNTLLVEEV